MKANIKRECILEQFPKVIGKIHDARDELIRKAEEKLNKYLDSIIGKKYGFWKKKVISNREESRKWLNSRDMWGDMYLYGLNRKIETAEITYTTFEYKLQAMLDAANSECYQEFWLSAKDIDAINSWLK